MIYAALPLVLARSHARARRRAALLLQRQHNTASHFPRRGSLLPLPMTATPSPTSILNRVQRSPPQMRRLPDAPLQISEPPEYEPAGDVPEPQRRRSGLARSAALNDRRSQRRPLQLEVSQRPQCATRRHEDSMAAEVAAEVADEARLILHELNAWHLADGCGSEAEGWRLNDAQAAGHSSGACGGRRASGLQASFSQLHEQAAAEGWSSRQLAAAQAAHLREAALSAQQHEPCNWVPTMRRLVEVMTRASLLQVRTPRPAPPRPCRRRLRAHPSHRPHWAPRPTSAALKPPPPPLRQAEHPSLSCVLRSPR